MKAGVTPAPRQALGGFLWKRERWTLSLRGKLLLLAVLVGAVWVAYQNVYSFL